MQGGLSPPGSRFFFFTGCPADSYADTSSCAGQAKINPLLHPRCILMTFLYLGGLKSKFSFLQSNVVYRHINDIFDES